MRAFRRYLIAQKRKKELFLILLKGLSFVTFLILGENLLLFPEAHMKSTKVHLNFMQSGLPLKLYASRQMRRWRCWCPVKNTRFTSVDMDRRQKKKNRERFFFTHQNVITYACITIHIRYANQFGIILWTVNDIYLIITDIWIFPLCVISFLCMAERIYSLLSK